MMNKAPPPPLAEKRSKKALITRKISKKVPYVAKNCSQFSKGGERLLFHPPPPPNPAL